MGTPKFICIILRGGMDGLSMIAPPDGAGLADYRPKLIPTESLPLTDGFAFHPALKNMHALFESGDLSFSHATGLPYQDRSHFKSQDILESGLEAPHPTTGWLARAINTARKPMQAVAYGTTIPLLLRGAADCFNWSNPNIDPGDEALLGVLEKQLYPQDALLAQAMDQLSDIRRYMAPRDKQGRKTKRRIAGGPFKTVGRMISTSGGPDIGVISMPDWDTHESQDRRIASELTKLDKGMGVLRETLGDVWQDTVIVVASEFGRSVRQNGTGGTDHGTGGAVIIAGGAISGGLRLGEWPGLEEPNLYEGRDLYPANDIREIFASVLYYHLGIHDDVISNSAFPGLASEYQSLPLFGGGNLA